MTMPPEPPLSEPAAAPEILVDGFSSSMVAGGVAKFTFFSMVAGASTGQPERRVVLRLSAPLVAVAGIHEALTRFLEEVAKAQRDQMGAN